MNPEGEGQNMVQAVKTDGRYLGWTREEPIRPRTEIRVMEAGRTALARVVGTLSDEQAELLLDRLRPVSRRTVCIVLDLRRVDVMDRAGYRALLTLHQEMTERGTELRVVARKESRTSHTLTRALPDVPFHLFESAVQAWITPGKRERAAIG
jgi:anti-anti-sigma factor